MFDEAYIEACQKAAEWLEWEPQLGDWVFKGSLKTSAWDIGMVLDWDGREGILVSWKDLIEDYSGWISIHQVFFLPRQDQLVAMLEERGYTTYSFKAHNGHYSVRIPSSGEGRATGKWSGSSPSLALLRCLEGVVKGESKRMAAIQ